STLSINYNLTRDGGLTAGEHFINSYRAGRFADVADFMDQFLRLLERSKKPYTDEDLRKKDLDALSGMVEGAGMGSTGQLHILILMISSPHLPSGCKAVGISDAGGLNVQCSP
ncbi:MAG: hypothetical protein JNK24_04345, partial [Alphaproteobacteria bacterium]|nr:hypothetical protein [Alphaproteobacteria bacterium]